MYQNRIVILAAVLVLMCTLYSGDDGQENGNESYNDVNNPKYFTKIFEIDNRGERRYIFDNNKNNALNSNPSSFEVDIKSKIDIIFDREFIAINNISDYGITIEGALTSNNSSKKIEMPGYSEVGKNKVTAKKSFSDLGKVTELLAEMHIALALVRSTNNDGSNKKKVLNAIDSLNLKGTLEEILRINDNVLVFIAEKLFVESGNNTKPIKDLANEILAEINNVQRKLNIQNSDENLKDINTDKIIEELTILSRYGTELKNSSKYRELYDSLNTELKDTSFIISETGAKSGDTIIIKIKNDERVLEVKILVKEFGMKVVLKDSFLFVRRSDSDFLPMPGVSLCQILYNSREQDGFCRWLKPGVGINVSFPQEEDTLDKTNPIPKGGMPLSTGLVFSIFENSVYLSGGLDLTSEKRYLYWGIGFSFIDIYSKIMSKN